MRRLGRTFSALVILLAAAIVSGIAILKSLDFNDYRGLIEREVEAATGRKLLIGGRLELAVSLVPTLKVDNVSFTNADWGTRPKMASLGKLEIEVELLPLFSRELTVNRLILREMDLLLETDAAGHANWEVADASAATESGSSNGNSNTVLPTVKNILIRNARIVYRDGRTGRTATLNLDRLELKSDDSTQPIQFRTSGKLDKDNFAAVGQFGSLASVTSGDGPFPISFDVNALGVSVRGNGKIDDLSEAKGLDVEVEAKIDDWSKLRKLLPDLQFFPYLPPARLSGRVQGSDHRIRLTALSLRTGESDIAGRIAIDLTALRPQIDADLTSERIDIRPFMPPTTASRRKSILPEFWSPDGLGSIDAKVSLRVKRLETGVLPLDDLQINAVVQDGHLALNDFRVRSAGSDLAGRLALYPQTRRPRIEVDLRSDRLDLVPLLAALEKLTPEGKLPAGRANRPMPFPFDVTLLNLVDADLAFRARRIETGKEAVTELAAKATITDGRLDVTSLALKVAGSDFAGHAALMPGELRPRIDVSLTSKRLNLEPLFSLNRGQVDGTPTKKPQDRANNKKVFSSEPFDLDGMQLVDGDLSIEIERIDGGGEPIEAFDAKATVKDGWLDVASLTFRVASGEVSAQGSIKADPGSHSTVVFRAQTKGVNSGALLKAWNVTSSIDGAVLQANIDFTGSGDSPAAVMATLNGEGLMTFGEARIRNDAVTFVGADLTQTLFSTLNPFSKKQGYTPVRCAVVHFMAKNGKLWAENGVGVQTDKINVLGSGNIDFSTEKIEFAAKTEARRKLGISLDSISSLAMVGGTLADPQPKLDKMSALGSAATVGAAVATFGLSIFAKKLLKIVSGSVRPCDVARDSSLIAEDQPAEGIRTPDDPS